MAAAMAVAAPAGATAPTSVVAAGRSADGKVAFRLDGDRLTVTFRRPLARHGSGARPFVTMVCGSDLVGAPLASSMTQLGTLVQARRDLRVRAGVRVVRARLNPDLGAWINRCGVRWRGREGSGEALALLTLKRGTPPGCVAPPGAAVRGESPRLVAIEVGSNSDYGGFGDRLACSKPDGAWRQLDHSSWNKYNYGRYVQLTVAGSWIGWTRQEISDSHDSSCSIWRLDLDAGGEPQQLAAAPTGGSGVFCGEQPVVAGDGRMAWIARDWAKTVERRAVDQVNAVGSDGTVVTLDTALDAEQHATLTNLTISADGSTVTWRNRGLERTAVLR